MKHVPCEPGPGIWVEDNDPNAERNAAIREIYLDRRVKPEPMPEQYVRGRYVVAALVVLAIAFIATGL